MSKDTTYLEHRLEEIGITNDENIISLIDPEAEFPMSKAQEVSCFDADSEGNILINYWTIQGERASYYTKAKNPKYKPYQAKRLRNPNGSGKYRFPAGQAAKPWFPPKLVEKYRKQQKVETLILTEGVFKAAAGAQHGLNVVALGSITLFKDKNGKLFPDIVNLIGRCKVRNIVILWDGDCRNISQKGLDLGDDISKRPTIFYSMVKKIRNLIIEADLRSTPSIYFKYPKSVELDHLSNPKGLDDILIEAAKVNELEGVIKECTKCNDENGTYFKTFNISQTTGKVFSDFGLNNVESFLKIHGQRLAGRNFKFQGGEYEYSEKEDDHILVKPAYAKDLYWVGNDFYEKVTMPRTKEDIVRQEYMHFNKDTLKARHGNDFQNYLDFYHGFANVPDHLNYRQTIEVKNKEGKTYRYLNKYKPFVHDPIPGAFENIMIFLKHIFGEENCIHSKTGEKIPRYELGLDYIQVLLTKPTQRLPILCLFSPENSTGKSTLLNLLAEIFQGNVIPVGENDLTGDFNEVFADKLLVVSEETLLDNKKHVDRIKALSTSKELTVNPKNRGQYTIDFFCKFMFFSNHKRFLKITRHDDRFWVIRIRPIAPSNRVGDFFEKMKPEIPHFIHFLLHRDLKTKREERMWFDLGLIRTDALQELVKENESDEAYEIRTKVEDYFLDYPNETELRITSQLINTRFLSGGRNITSKRLHGILTEELLVNQLANKKGKKVNTEGKFKFKDEHNNEYTIPWKGRPYVFLKNQFEDDDLVNSEN